MKEFVESFVVPLLTRRRGLRVCEIGASFGASTDVLVALPNIAITVIDPCLDCDLSQKFAGTPHVTVKKGISLDVLPELDDAFDCILIDGDHNWYTVYHELKVISERNLLKPGGMIFLHDVEWPWGRRDMYFQPEMVPSQYRHSWEQKGVVRGQSELSDRGGIWLAYRKATHEGGARNGVLTAIEDFLSDHDTEYDFFRVRGHCGLGIMYRRKSFADDLMFLSLEGKGILYNGLGWPRRFAEVHFLSGFSLAKSLLGKARK